MTVGAFALACLLLFAFLRRRGHRPWAACVGVVAFALSPPVGELIAAPFLVEPLACALLIALLLALEMGLGVGTLALIAVLGVLAKEVVLLFLPVVYFAARTDQRSRAARDAIVVGAAAVAALLLLRVVWTPHLSTPVPDLGAERFRLLWNSFRFEPMRWLAVTAVGGLTLAAIRARCAHRRRSFLRRYAWVLAAALCQPLLAHYAIQQVVGEMNRYLLYAVPVLVGLALLALDRVCSEPGAAAGPAPAPPSRLHQLDRRRRGRSPSRCPCSSSTAIGGSTSRDGATGTTSSASATGRSPRRASCGAAGRCSCAWRSGASTRSASSPRCSRGCAGSCARAGATRPST